MPGPADQGDKKYGVGTDGKRVELSIPKFLKSEPWYVETSNSKAKRQRTDQSLANSVAQRDAAPALVIRGPASAQADTGGGKPEATSAANANSAYGSGAWEEKRDIYNNYDAEEYARVVDSFQTRTQQSAAPVGRDGKIVDPYSRVVATPSARDIKDTAYYLKEFGGEDLDFETSSQQVTTLKRDESTTTHSTRVDIPASPSRTKLALGLREDIYRRDHSTVYGSYWGDGRWGYKCCKQFEFDSFCTVPDRPTRRPP